MFQLKGKFQKITKPQQMQSGDKTFKKSSILVNFEVEGKNGKLTKQLALDLFGMPDPIEERAKKIHDTFSIDDSVDVSFSIESRQGKNGGWFTTARLHKIEHAAKQQNDGWDEGRSNDNWEDDTPF